MGGGVFVGALPPAEMPKPCRASRLKKNGENAPRSVRGRKRSAARRSCDARRLYHAPVRRWPCSSRSGLAWPDAACSALLIGPVRHARSALRVTALADRRRGVFGMSGDMTTILQVIGSSGTRWDRQSMVARSRRVGPQARIAADCVILWSIDTQGFSRGCRAGSAGGLQSLGMSLGEMAPGAARGLAGPVACPSATVHAVPGEALFGAGASGQTGLGAVIAAARPLRC